MAGWLGGIGDAFADRNFRIYSIGSILSWLSFFVQMVAMSWTTWELTHSTTWLAIIAILDIAPNLDLSAARRRAGGPLRSLPDGAARLWRGLAPRSWL